MIRSYAIWKKSFACTAAFLLCYVFRVQAQKPVVSPVGEGWAASSVNTTVFRKNSLVTWRDSQFVAYYNADRYLVLGKRKQGDAHWKLQTTAFQGNVHDAHNSISIMADGDGYLHVAWDHHNSPLRYCRSVSPGSLQLSPEQPMTGQEEQRVTYPEFHKLPNGDLIFLYRSGESGEGNVIVNRYDVHDRRWTMLHRNLIDGQGTRSAYWQACTDTAGVIHLSWVWRESSDVASNHDICYARSGDGGKTWEDSYGKRYALPITAATAEYVCHVPQGSELINQTSMTTDASGMPYIATYWKNPADKAPQYHILFREPEGWQTRSLNFRKTSFSLSGTGTRSIPISRPQLIVDGEAQNAIAYLIFRDQERGRRISVATYSPARNQWLIQDLNLASVGAWEPTYDTELWKEKQILNLFVQHVGQGDGDAATNLRPQPVQVLEWNLKARD